MNSRFGNMRIVYFLLSLSVTLIVIVLLSSSFGSAPPLGKFLSPQHGFWQNAEPTGNDISSQINVTGIEKPVEIYFDERLVPHIFAQSESDAYFVQGYLHAKFRLWQMEFQTYAAAGRLSEILGPGPDSAFLNNDRNMRRLGMVFGARRSLSEMEKDAETKRHLEAYTEGVNSYIDKLTQAELPLEYRLLNYVPERWSPMKTSLLLKYLSFDLTGSESDVEYTNAKAHFAEEEFRKLYPLMHDSSSPVIPKGTYFPDASVQPVIPATADSLYFEWKQPVNIMTIKTAKDNGSNNWVAGGTKTLSGRPILCNDPHLGLNLPSLWYEIQITTPSHSVYGVSLPGAPSVVIGFNDSVAWGVTNAARDVLDYYRITFNGNDKSQYMLNGSWKNSELKIETYRMKDGSVFTDTVAYTVFGPVMYDDHFNGKGRVAANVNLAVRWMAHEPSNELKTFTSLNKSKSYKDYVEAIKHFSCPGQNFAFASKTGDIALWQQGKFPAKWSMQGDFIMPGTDTSYSWQQFIPHEDNPHIINPSSGFVSSANQIPADISYPYYLGGDYDVYRGLHINRMLSIMESITPDDMQRLQSDNFNNLAHVAIPYLLSHISEEELSKEEKRYLEMIRSWSLRNDNEETAPTVFFSWYDILEQFIWKDELDRQPGASKVPDAPTLIEALMRDSVFSFADDVNTPEVEGIDNRVTQAFKKACVTLVYTEKDGKLRWSKFKDAGIRHLLRMEPLSRFHLNTGGGRHVINATQQFRGPSWKMIVQMTDQTEAFGIYPGGQSGNAGSRDYDPFVNDWAEGKYYRLWIMKKEEARDKRIRYSIRLSATNHNK